MKITSKAVTTGARTEEYTIELPDVRKITFKFNDLDGTPDEASCYYMVLELVQP